MNPQLFAVLSAHADWFAERFGETRPVYYLFPFREPTPDDPTRPITDIARAWEALRKRAGVQCRLHDLGHTAATKMAEAAEALTIGSGQPKPETIPKGSTTVETFYTIQ